MRFLAFLLEGAKTWNIKAISLSSSDAYARIRHIYTGYYSKQRNVWKSRRKIGTCFENFASEKSLLLRDVDIYRRCHLKNFISSSIHEYSWNIPFKFEYNYIIMQVVVERNYIIYISIISQIWILLYVSVFESIHLVLVKHPT